MSIIRKIRDKIDVRRSSAGRVSGSCEDIPLDHQLTFRRDSEEEWKYRDGQIYINDLDVEDFVDYETRDVRLWCGISEALGDYKTEVEKRSKYECSGFMAKASAIQDRIFSNLRHLYDEKVNGLYLTCGNGEYLLNNFNVRAFLAMYHLRPTEKARHFLVGLKSQLELILMNRSATTQLDRVQRVVQKLYNEVLGALEIQPIETRRLTSAGRDSTL